MIREFTFEHLKSAEFEEYCQDLLRALGYLNVDWRKGTASTSSPADQGRDIECERSESDIDGHTRMEKWFVECKHYTSGIPPSALNNALGWAEAEDPAVLLFICSGFLSNGSKQHLQDYSTNRHPRFRIKYWERPDLQRLTVGRPEIMRRYHYCPTESLARRITC